MSHDQPEQLIRGARRGDVSQLGRLLDLYRNYLRFVARSQMAQRDGGIRYDPSDLIQETCLEAHRDFGQFTGATEAELMAWLRRILVRNLADQYRYDGAQRRDWRKQQSLARDPSRSSMMLWNALEASISTPSMSASRREQAAVLSDALAELPEDYQEVILLRHVHQMKFAAIGEQMNRSTAAVRMLWVRALEKLRDVLHETNR